MHITYSVADTKNLCAKFRTQGRLALVPTMGALHDAHLSLVDGGRERCDFVTVSIFVNPLQFAANEDLSDYPRPLADDIAKARAAGVDAVFVLPDEDMYPGDFKTSVMVNEITDEMEGASRPGHFEGVCTVITKLFMITQCDVACFGEKDFQQLAVARQLVRDLNIPTQILGCPIMRESDGLAMSSRNLYLTPEERGDAAAINLGIRRAQEAFHSGERDPEALIKIARDTIDAGDHLSPDYACLVHPENFESVTEATPDSRLIVAAFVRSVRLLDNAAIGGRDGNS